MRVRILPSFKEALKALEEAFSDVGPIGREEVELKQALGRVLAEDIRAPIDVPSFSRATMDGYAVRAEDTFGASVEEPVELKLIGRIRIGEEATLTLGPGECVQVSTGSMLPEGANAVVRLEDAEEAGGTIRVFEPAVPGQNVMAVGADIGAGDVVLRAGEFLTPAKIGVLSALGFTRVPVFKKPRVAVLSTGEELVRPGEPLPMGKVYDVNWITIMTSVEALGGKATFLGVVGDDADEIANAMAKGLRSSDMLVATGASSVGASDVMRDALGLLGAELILNGVRTKPGKPTIIARAYGKPVFCLPGNPTSALMTFTVFVEPVLARMAGLRAIWRPLVEAVLTSRLIPDTGRHNFVPVALSRSPDGSLLAQPILKGSGAITSLAHAHGFIEVPEGTEFLPKGSKVIVRLFWPMAPLGRFELDVPLGG